MALSCSLATKQVNDSIEFNCLNQKSTASCQIDSTKECSFGNHEGKAQDLLKERETEKNHTPECVNVCESDSEQKSSPSLSSKLSHASRIAKAALDVSQKSIRDQEESRAQDPKHKDVLKTKHHLNRENTRQETAVTQHFVSKILNMTKCDVIESLPCHFQQEIGCVGQVSWRPGKNGQTGCCPVLVSLPFDLCESDKIMQEWVDMHRSYKKEHAKCKLPVCW